MQFSKKSELDRELTVCACLFVGARRWDPRSSVVTPDEEVFYLVAFLRSALPGAPESLEALARQNQRILDLCAEAGIGAKQYLPNHKAQHEWAEHFGAARWERFARLKAEFDPRAILATGQGIFRPPGSPPLVADSQPWIHMGC